MKKFKSFYKMALPLLTIVATTTAIPLAACSNSKKDDNKLYNVIANVTSSSGPILDDTISLEFGDGAGASVTLTATDISATLASDSTPVDAQSTDWSYLWTVNNTDAVLTSEKTASVTIKNNTISNEDVEAQISLKVSNAKLNIVNKEVKTFKLILTGEHRQETYVPTGTITVGGVAHVNDVYTLTYGDNDTLKITDFKVNNEAVNDEDWSVEWRLSSESASTNQYATINNANSKTDATIVNNNTTDAEVSVKVEVIVNCEKFNINNVELSVINFTLENQVEQGEQNDIPYNVWMLTYYPPGQAASLLQNSYELGRYIHNLGKNKEVIIDITDDNINDYAYYGSQLDLNNVQFSFGMSFANDTYDLDSLVENGFTIANTCGSGSTILGIEKNDFADDNNIFALTPNSEGTDGGGAFYFYFSDGSFKPSLSDGQVKEVVFTSRIDENTTYPEVNGWSIKVTFRFDPANLTKTLA